MNELSIVWHHVLLTPYLWSAMGSIAGVSVFISPVFFNGDYRAANKIFVSVMGYMIFAILIFWFHYNDPSHISLITGLPSHKLEPFYQVAIVIFMVAISYCIGLFSGIFVYRVAKKQGKKYEKISAKLRSNN